MKRIVAVISMIILASICIDLISDDVEGIGPPSITIVIDPDHPGSDPGSPIDLSTGNYEYNIMDPAVDDIWIEVQGEVVVTSQFPQIIRKVVVDLLADLSHTIYGDIGIDYYFEPSSVVFSDIMPGDTLTQNYTLFLRLNDHVPAGDNVLSIYGHWFQAPDPIGKPVPSETTPLHIAPVVSAGFGKHRNDISLTTNDSDQEIITLYNHGNEFDPELSIEIKGVEDAEEKGIELIPVLIIDNPGSDDIGYVDLEIFTQNADPGTQLEIELVLIDEESGREVDSTDIEIKILEEYEPPVDDDDPPVDDDDPPVDDDDEPLTWTHEQCERSYLDASGDDVTYWSTLDTSLKSDSGVDLDQNSRLDIRKVEVLKEEGNLVVEIDMRSTPEYGITDTGVYNVYLYFLDKDSGHTQPPLDLGRDPDLVKEDYQPSSAVATTSLFHGGSYWMCEMEIRGSSYFIKGSISSLISSGVDPDFELFVKVEYTDLENFVTEDSLNVRITTDYAGFGAWEVDPSLLYIEGSDQDLGIFGSGNILIYGASVMVIAVLAVAILIYFVVRKKSRKTVPVYAESQL